MTSKKCFKCHVVKDLGLFHDHPQKKDGKLRDCMECIETSHKLANERERAKDLKVRIIQLSKQGLTPSLILTHLRHEFPSGSYRSITNAIDDLLGDD